MNQECMDILNSIKDDIDKFEFRLSELYNEPQTDSVVEDIAYVEQQLDILQKELEYEEKRIG